MSIRYSYQEWGHICSVVTLPNGHTYYTGDFKCRSTARRFAKKENAKHRWAASNGFIYNTRRG